MMISIIAAVGKNNVIGIGNSLPWNLPEDLKRFREITMGKPLIMGERTFHSIGRPLPGRKNIVLTLDENFSFKGCIAARSIKEALDIAMGSEEVMVIGGASVYSQFLPLANRIYLTLIDGDFKGDAYFPEIDFRKWREISRIDNEPGDDNPYKYSFIILEKKDNEEKPEQE